MATVSHYDMQPYPTRYGGKSTQLTSTQYYVASNHQLAQMYDKTKKTWSQRLKISKAEKTSSPLSELPDFSQSALSRSMKYAEPWLYGTVRGIPAPQVHGQAIFTPIPSEVAVVVCSCPEFLNGTKKEIKKASVCKKCKGSRLPFAPIGGTVRLRPTSAPIIHAPRGSAGTVRLPTSSSIKSRPSIIDPKNDPYDLMRRSRLVTPEPKQIADKALKLRAKSASPTRGRSRNRPTSIRPEDLATKNNIVLPNNGTGSIRPRNTLRLKSERWLESIEHDPGGRKSILQCNVNPYDLISTKSQTNNEFAPEQEDMFLPSPKMESVPKIPISPSVKAISGQRISFGEANTKNKDISKFIQSPAESKGVSRKTDISVKNDTKRQEDRVQLNLKAYDEQNQPKRPPRKKQDIILSEEDAVLCGDRSLNEVNQKNKSKTIATPITLSLSTESAFVASPAGIQGIKSILKRPSPVTPSPSDIDAKNNESDTTATSSDISGSKTLSTGTTDTIPSFGQNSLNLEKPSRSVSQFYLPLPQTRKKVQFMGENRIIYCETAGESATMHTSVQDVASDSRDEPNVTLKRKHTRITTTAANSEPYLKDANVLKNGSDIAEKQNEQSVDSIACERNQYRIPLHLEIESGRESDNRVGNENSNNLQVTAVRNSTKDVKEIRAISDGTEQENGDFKISCFDRKQAQENCSGRIALLENGRRDNIDHQEDSDSFDIGTTAMDSKVPSSSATRRGVSLRRTHSARSNHTTTVFLNFNDTMALRIKNARPDSRDIFREISGTQSAPLPTSLSLASVTKPDEYPTDTQQLSLKQEGKDSMSSSHANVIPSRVTKAVVSSMPLPTNSRPDLKARSSPTGKSLSTGTDDRNPSRSKMQQQRNEQDFTTKENSRALVADCAAATQPARPPRQVNKKIWWQEENESNEAVKNELEQNPLINNSDNVIDGEISGLNKCPKTMTEIPLSIGKDDKAAKAQNIMSTHAGSTQKQSHSVDLTKEAKLLQARNEILIGSRLFGSAPDRSVQKTIVKVTPFDKKGSEVHRLKIRHEDESRSLNFIPQKKTSIMINGDNCYSTINVGNDTPLYQSSVVVNNGASTISTETLKPYGNTVTISVSNPSTPEDEITFKNNKINSLLSLNNSFLSVDSSSSTVSPSCSSSTISDGDSSSCSSSLKRGTTLITLGSQSDDNLKRNKRAFKHEHELVSILRNPVEAVRRNLVPHICGKSETPQANDSPPSTPISTLNRNGTNSSNKLYSSSFIGKLLEDPTLQQVAEGLENEVMVRLIESSLKRLKESRQSVDTSGTKDNDDMNKLIDLALQKVSEERVKIESKKQTDAVCDPAVIFHNDHHENGSISSGNSYGSANYDLFDFDNNESDCYQSCSSEMTTEEDAQSTRSKFYQMLVDATLSEIEISTTNDDDHHYESIRVNCDPIYEEISDVPPPLPLSSPPIGEGESEKKGTKSMFEGASKYDILSYLVDAKERGLVREEPYEYNFSNMSEIIIEEEVDTLTDLNKSKINDISSRVSHLSMTSDSSEEISLNSSINDKLTQRRPATEVERNDSGVGSETSKSSRSKYLNSTASSVVSKNSPVHLCEDCDGPVETQVTESGVMYAPLVCRKCSKKRAERKEIIIEIVETEEKYGRDLQIILEEFCKPMLVAGLLTQEQLSAIFLNTEELLENNQTLAEKMRDALDIATEQGDDDLLTVNVGKVFLEATPMLHAFETYCVRQAAASLLLANLEKDKELLRIFLRVSQMENAVLRRMNLNSFLMVPVQRVTKYPLLLARLYKVTPTHLQSRALLKQAQEKIELHLNHMNQEAKDVPTKLWRRISSSSPNRRLSCEIDMINIKLRKLAIDVLEWNHDEVRFAMEGKLLFTQPTDNNWKKARTIKLTHVNALLVTNGKPSTNYKPDKAVADQLSFPKHTGIREASLLMVKEKCGRYTLIREPLYLDRCIVCTEADWDDYFEVHEISSKDTFIFKAEDGTRTKQWYTQLQYHSQGMGAWRKRRNALANIMINGMLSRT